MDKLDNRPIWTQRAEMGLTTPMPQEKLAVWSKISIPQARIFEESGGYRPFRIVDQAHFHPARNILLAGGIRGSKSVSAAAEAVSWSPHSDLIWFGADSYDLARQEFEYTAEALLSLDWTAPRLVNMPDNRFHPCSLETHWGTLIETRTLHDVNTFVARAPHLIVICEPGLASEAALRRARERLATFRGRLYLPGTFEEVRSQWMEDIWRRWARWPNPEHGKSFTVPSWVNRVIFPQGKHDPEITALRNSCKTYEEFLRRVVGVPAAMPDLIMSDVFSKRTHLGHVPWVRKDSRGDPVPVYLAIDPGYSGGHYVVYAVQVVDGMVRVFDEVDMVGSTHDYVVMEAASRDWWPFANTGTCDPYASVSHVFGSHSPTQYWWDLGHVALTTPSRLHVEELVQVLKSYLKDPLTGKTRLVVDEVRCPRLTYEMAHWRRRKSYDGPGIPAKSNCDAIKALGYFLVNLRGREMYQGSPGVVTQPYQVR